MATIKNKIVIYAYINGAIVNHNREKIDSSSFSLQLINFNQFESLEITAGFVIYHNDKIWNHDPDDADDPVVGLIEDSLGFLKAGASIASGEKTVNFYFWEFSNAELKDNENDTLSLSEYTIDKKIEPNPYFDTITFDTNEFYEELVNASNTIIEYFKPVVEYSKNILPENILKKSLINSIAIEQWIMYTDIITSKQKLSSN
ncbi:MAG: hypothetical protein MUC87_17405 [Bacteroidia bacterium]|jgi:hypothetical protein|nr:hypothetical protein [Bacteroidia bacterium]